VKVVEHQGGWFDPDAAPGACEDLGGQDDVLAQWDAAGTVLQHAEDDRYSR
jgi:hypothetical protein